MPTYLRNFSKFQKLRHENLVNLIEFFRRKRRLYLVFEYVDHTILDELEATETGLDEDTARAHIFQVLRGIAFCHQNQVSPATKVLNPGLFGLFILLASQSNVQLTD